MVYSVKGSKVETFAVPTDWTVYIVYNIGMFKGEAIIKSYVTHYNDDDLDDIFQKWQPTGTSYIPSWER